MSRSTDPSRDPLRACLVEIHGDHPELRTSRGILRGRPALLWILAQGERRGLGEACPLPNFGRASDGDPADAEAVEDFDTARTDLLRLTESVSRAGTLRPQGPAGSEVPFSSPEGTSFRSKERLPALLEQAATISAPLRSPAARHAAEAAWLQLQSHEREEPLSWCLGTASGAAGEPRPFRLAESVVLDPLSAPAEEIARRIREHFMNHIRTFKLKFGRDDDQELFALEHIRDLGLPLHLRLDPNLSWTPERAERQLTRVRSILRKGSCHLDFVEDPTPDFAAWETLARIVPLAIDEPLATSEPPTALSAAGVVVLKPMVLGGASRVVDLARAARAAGKRVNLSHSFDGPVALSHSVALAFALQSRDLAPGLGLHVGLETWKDLSRARVIAGDPALLSTLPPGELSPPRTAAGAFLRPPVGDRLDAGREVGLGVRSSGTVGLEAPVEDEQLLTPRPRQCVSGEALALLVRERAAALPDEPFLSLVCTPTIETVVDLLAAWHWGQPVLLLHPAAPEAQREELHRRALSAAQALSPGDAAIVPTSGSSGPPHLVVHTRRSLLAAAEASFAHHGRPLPGDRCLLSLPFSHVGGLAILVRCLLGGATLLLDPLPREATAAIDRLAELRVQLLSLVPTQLQRLLAAPGGRIRPGLLPDLALVLLGGAACPFTLLEQARQAGLPLAPTYGMTEMGSQVATLPATSPLDPSAIGHLLPGVRARVRPEDGRLLLGGPMRFRRYLDEPAPLTEDGWFVSGDRAELFAPEPDAPPRLRALGRADEIIITGGENVSPQEVELALGDLAEVELAYVFPLPDVTWGERVAALWVPRPPAGARADLGTLLRAQGRLPSHAIPKVFFDVTDLPLLPTGKLDRRAARAQAERRLIDRGAERS